MHTTDFNYMLTLLKAGVLPATGCTEPIAVAYSAAITKKHAPGELQSLEIWVDHGLYKNGAKVGIPGTSERGLELAAAMGYVAGKSELQLRVIENISPEAVQLAKQLVQQGKVKVQIKQDCDNLYIETLLLTTTEKVRVVTLNKHLNIISVEKGEQLTEITIAKTQINEEKQQLQSLELQDFYRFTREVQIDELAFLEEGLRLNLLIAEEGLKRSKGISKAIAGLMDEGVLHEGLMFYAQKLCSAASEARMSGSNLPVMTIAGSGNQGIVVFLTILAAGEKLKASRERVLRALALSALLTIYIKSYTGTLSAMCGCAIAAGTAASAGVVYLMDGSEAEISGAILNMIGTLAGMICDGAKEGCAYKLALSTGWAVQSALLAMNGAAVCSTDGILTGDFKQLLVNLGAICNYGMVHTDKIILEIMERGDSQV